MLLCFWPNSMPSVMHVMTWQPYLCRLAVLGSVCRIYAYYVLTILQRIAYRASMVSAYVRHQCVVSERPAFQECQTLFPPDRLPINESPGLPPWLAVMTFTRSAALGRCSGTSERQAVNSCAISAGHSSGILQADHTY